jgi:hypothetical protein
MDIGGIPAKLEKHAEKLAAGLGMYAHEREYGGGIQTLIQYLTNDFTGKGHGALYEIQYDVQHPDFYVWKLLNSGHLYSTLFKIGAIAWGAGELGITSKYKTLGKKLATGSAIAAALMQGSGNGASNGSASRGASGIQGY